MMRIDMKSNILDGWLSLLDAGSSTGSPTGSRDSFIESENNKAPMMLLFTWSRGDS
jgi:hypothetical protein